MDDSLGSHFVERNDMDIQDEMPVPKEEIVDIKADDSDLDIIEVHCNINPNRKPAIKKHKPNMMMKKIVKNSGNKQSSSVIQEEIVISDSSDTDYDPLVKKQPKPSYSTRRSKEDSLSSIILNCPKCNKTKTVFSTTLTSECKECKVNMNFVCNECNLMYETLLALFRHKKIQCKKYLSPVLQFVHKCIRCQVKYKICNLSKQRNCLKCKHPMSYECTICGKEQLSHAVIYRHVRNKCQSQSRAYFCNDCPYKGPSQRALLLHMSSCHQNLYMLHEKCNKCGKSFANHLSLEQHKAICGMAYYFCKVCPYRPRMRLSLRRHLMVLHKVPKDDVEKMLDDSICPQSYVAAIAVKNANESRNFTLKRLTEVTCKKCNFTQPVEKRKIKCSKCNANLVFQCLYCPMRFRLTTLLQRHAKRMHGQVEHVCKLCSKAFSFFGDYNDHQKSCGKEPQNACHLCSFKTKYRHNLKGHLEKLHNINRPLYVCQDCGVEYKTPRAMDRHFEVGCDSNPSGLKINKPEKTNC